MTHRQRVIAALQHKESDRVPVELGATDSSGITGIAYNRLKRHLDISGRCQIPDIYQMIAKVEPSVADFVGSDAVALLLEPRCWKPWTLADGSAAEIPQKADLRPLPNGETVLVLNQA